MALGYDPSKLPQPITHDQMFMCAILVELRAIRIALQNTETTTVRVGDVAKTVSTPFVQTDAPQKLETITTSTSHVVTKKK